MPTCAGAGHRAPYPRRARAPGAGDAILLPGRRGGASADQRTTPATLLPEPEATTTAPQAGWGPRRTRPRPRDHRSAWVTARRRPGPSPAVGPETGWGGRDAPGDTVRVACGSRAGSAFPWATPASKAAQQQPNARGELRPKRWRFGRQLHWLVRPCRAHEASTGAGSLAWRVKYSSTSSCIRTISAR